MQQKPVSNLLAAIVVPQGPSWPSCFCHAELSQNPASTHSKAAISGLTFFNDIVVVSGAAVIPVGTKKCLQKSANALKGQIVRTTGGENQGLNLQSQARYSTSPLSI